MNKFLEKAAFLGTFGGAISAGEGHRWGGAGTGFLGDVAGRVASTALLKAKPGSAIMELTGGASGIAAGHFYGKHARKKDALHKRASVNSLIEDGVDFDTAVALAQKFF